MFLVVQQRKKNSNGEGCLEKGYSIFFPGALSQPLKRGGRHSEK